MLGKLPLDTVLDCGGRISKRQKKNITVFFHLSNSKEEHMKICFTLI